MKFYKGQKVICIAEKNEWNPVLSDFNRNLQLALGQEPLPEKNKEYEVTNNLALSYKGCTYININGFNDTPVSERAFVPLTEKESSEKEVSFDKFGIKEYMLSLKN